MHRMASIHGGQGQATAPIEMSDWAGRTVSVLLHRHMGIPGP